MHTQDASYLDVIHDEPDEWNPSDYAYQLTRRARGLPLWFSLAVHGSDAYRDAIERVLATAHAPRPTASARSPTSSSCASPSCRSCCSAASGWTGADYDAWSARLLDEQIAFVTPSRWHGEPVARLAFLHPETTLDIVDEILATTLTQRRRSAHAPQASPRRCASSSAASIARACAPFGGITRKRA